MTAWSVYRLMGANGADLYVGMTTNVPRRMAEHRARFGDEIKTWSFTEYGTKAEAVEAEARLIADLRPIHNLYGQPGHKRVINKITPTGSMLSIEQVAEELGVSVATIYMWRHRGTAPKASKVGRHLRWRQTDVDAWLDERAS